MSKEPDFLLIQLKQEIQNRFGTDILYDADCQRLSELLLVKTKRKISVSTLKRFFGLVKSPNRPSKYTLDTLAQFLQFTDWLDFLNRFEKEEHPYAGQDSWDSLKERSKLVTEKSIQSIHRKIGNELTIQPLRKFARKKINRFLESSAVATAFIGSNGAGKSSIALRSTEFFFSGETAKYPNDIVCLIDGCIFYNLLSVHKKINRLNNLIEFDPHKSFSQVFNERPDLVKGRFVLIIDGIDDIFPDYNKTDEFVQSLTNIVSFYAHIPWFKLIITCRPITWRFFVNRMQGNLTLKSLWFDETFHGADYEFVNIPKLTASEIKSTLRNNEFKVALNQLRFNHPDILECIANPYQLHLFIKAYKDKGEIYEIDLLNQYISNTILSEPFSYDKFQLIKSFFELCDMGKKGQEVKKEDLQLSSSRLLAYNEISNSEIFYEYSIQDSYLSLNTFVRFKQNVVFVYYLLNTLIRENGLSIELLKEINTQYRNLPQLRCSLLKYAIKILVKENQITILKDIFSIISETNTTDDTTPNNLSQCMLTNTLASEIRTNTKLRETLIPHFAQSETARKLFFENFFDMDSLVLFSGNNLDYYLKYNQSDEARSYVCFMKFMQYFLASDEEKCTEQYQHNKNLQAPSVDNPLNLAFYYIPRVIYQSVFNDRLDNSFFAEIRRISSEFATKAKLGEIESPQFEFAIIFALNYSQYDQEIIELSEFIFENYELSHLRPTGFYQFFMLIYAKALLHSNQTEKAKEIYREVKVNQTVFPEHLKRYMKIRILLIQSEFRVVFGKTGKAIKKLDEVISIAKLLKFNYFYDKAIQAKRYLQPQCP
ncbi:hypothetical protein [Mangrovibacterium sp.]|uniref:hypothetical protein n=1 Tax=Mangrovibacterium sp. TaxID=1961364 RepID=UPI0035686CAC